MQFLKTGLTCFISISIVTVTQQAPNESLVESHKMNVLGAYEWLHLKRALAQNKGDVITE